MKKTGSGAGTVSRSISQRCGSEDPDQYQNVMDPAHRFRTIQVFSIFLCNKNSRIEKIDDTGLCLITISGSRMDGWSISEGPEHS
jgi:hypothetical protein